MFAAATDEARPILTGVLTKFIGRQADPRGSRQLPHRRQALSILDPVEETSLVVPARSYDELMRILSDTDDPVDVMLASAKSQVIFHVEGTDLVSRLIDGQFPNYQQVLPTSHASRAVVERDELLKAVRLSALIASTAANVVRLRLGDDGADGDHRSPRRPTSATPRARSRRRSRATRSRSPSTRATCRRSTEPRRRPAGPGVHRPAFAGRAAADRE